MVLFSHDSSTQAPLIEKQRLIHSSLNQSIVCEGVNNSEQLAIIDHYGYEMVQGTFLANGYPLQT